MALLLEKSFEVAEPGSRSSTHAHTLSTPDKEKLFAAEALTGKASLWSHATRQGSSILKLS